MFVASHLCFCGITDLFHSSRSTNEHSWVSTKKRFTRKLTMRLGVNINFILTYVLSQTDVCIELDTIMGT